jgi:hypothetical protein
MLRSKTVFIVGAGASCEARLPTSVHLTGKIATKLNLSAALPLLTQLEPLPQLDTGDPAIAQAIIDHLQAVDKADIAHFRSFIEAAWKTRNAMPQALSIDSFIHAHRDDAEIELCGKLGIAQVILSAEGESTLCFVEGDEVGVPHEQLVDTWYLRCFQLLYEDVVKSQIASLFENSSFVIFNYDRCVEHYLYHSLRNWYGIPADDCEELLRKCKFLHPYGL